MLFFLDFQYIHFVFFSFFLLFTYNLYQLTDFYNKKEKTGSFLYSSFFIVHHFLYFLRSLDKQSITDVVMQVYKDVITYPAIIHLLSSSSPIYILYRFFAYLLLYISSSIKQFTVVELLTAIV